MKVRLILFLSAIVLFLSSCNSISLFEESIEFDVKRNIVAINYAIKEYNSVNNNPFYNLYSGFAGVYGVDLDEKIIVGASEKSWNILFDVESKAIEDSSYELNAIWDRGSAEYNAAYKAAFEEMINNKSYEYKDVIKSVYNVYMNTSVVLSEFEKVNDTTYLVYELRTGIMFYIEENDEIGFIVTADENSLEAYLQSKIK